MDAFTTSDIVSRTRGTTGSGRDRVNYMRNSVKVVVDAYDGTTTFYVFDDEDPIIAAYRGDLPDALQGRVGDAAGPAQARALPGAAAASCRRRSTACIT